jgi:hypothetical protein
LTSVGRTASAPWTKKKGVSPVGLVAVVLMDHKMDWRLSNHFLPQAPSFALNLFVLSPLRTSALARSA